MISCFFAVLFQGGRDSPSMSRAMQNDDGWNQVPSKNSRSVTQVDPSRLKITKVFFILSSIVRPHRD